MTKRNVSAAASAITVLSTTVLSIAAVLVGPVAHAEAQCRPDDLFCAELRIGPADPPPPPPPPPVVVQPPPVIYVQPAPPPPPPPRPPVVYVQPAPPPPPPPPQVVIVRPPAPPPPRVVTVQRPPRPRREHTPETFDVGLHLAFMGMGTADVGMGGFQGALRLRPIRHIALDLGVGILGGESLHYQRGGERWEVPVTLDVLFFFNPQHRFQVYALVGGGVSYAQQDLGHGGVREFEYAGGEAGLGIEWRIGRRFALHIDGRGFLRSYVGGGLPEFSRFERSGVVETTNLSGGFYGTVGMTFYFGE